MSGSSAVRPTWRIVVSRSSKRVLVREGQEKSRTTVAADDEERRAAGDQPAFVQDLFLRLIVAFATSAGVNALAVAITDRVDVRRPSQAGV